MLIAASRKQEISTDSCNWWPRGSLRGTGVQCFGCISFLYRFSGGLASRSYVAVSVSHRYIHIYIYVYIFIHISI